ncbi:nuclear transport factor 2 family protein [Actinophytocola sp.]|uniref:nuclear transport factor 2 family protein n=1 Tax=Actinophytocola sp. TaxID=1872138 RepID=UPI003D6B7DF5
MSDDHNGPALRTALAYHRAWTSGDLDGAMAYVADDVFWRTPGEDLTGKDAYRDFLGGFLRVFTGSTDVAAFGDQEQALLCYYPHTDVTGTAPAAEHLTIRDGQIVENLLVFDRLSFAPPQA